MVKIYILSEMIISAVINITATVQLNRLNYSKFLYWIKKLMCFSSNSICQNVIGDSVTVLPLMAVVLQQYFYLYCEDHQQIVLIFGQLALEQLLF